MIVGCIRKFEPSGSVTDMVHGALKIVRTEENLDRVRETSQLVHVTMPGSSLIS
jgi:hypothetical protein